MQENKFLLQALNLSKKHLGLTAPNPCVGCLIVKDGEIIGFGVTDASGRPHAEKIAIDSVLDKKNLVGATIYVTLEPCCHHGKTLPCVDEIISVGISRAVIAAIDPDPRVNRLGIKKLHENGVEVIIQELSEAYEINRGFFTRVKTGRPFVTLKIATSSDGKIATKTNESKWITGQKARDFGHYLRSINDGILVGSKTLKHDNPKLDCRIAGLEKYSPKKFVISSNCDFDLDFEMLKNGGLILSNKKGVDGVIFCEPENDLINLEDALKKIAQNDVNSLLVEGGQRLSSELIKKNLVDEIVWIRNSKIIGDDGIAAFGEFGIEKLENAISDFKIKELRQIDENNFVTIYSRELN